MRNVSCVLLILLAGGVLSGGTARAFAGDALDQWMMLAEAPGEDGDSVRESVDRPLRLEDFTVREGVIVWRAPRKVPRKFWTGAGVAFLEHETGHVLTNLLVGSTPRVQSVHYGPIPFFTWEPDHKLNDRDHYLTASAGFTAQHIVDEWILTRHPRLKDERDPYLKGMLTFSYWLSVGYGLNAFIGGGPEKRDTKGMADAARMSEATMGVLVMAPALLDAYRYNHPEARWARRASRAAKVLTVALALRCHH